MPICTYPGCPKEGQEQAQENFITSSKFCKTCRDKLTKRIQTVVVNDQLRHKEVTKIKYGSYRDLTTKAVDFVFSFYDYRCMYCGKPWEVMDHIEPLAEGGDSTIENIGPACKTCNLKKGSMTFIDWVEESKMSDEVLSKILWAQEHLIDLYYEAGGK